jgi:hypothetical protein
MLARACAQLLIAAIDHADEDIRMQCLEMVVVSPRLTDPPSQLELEVRCGLWGPLLPSLAAAAVPDNCVLHSNSC